MTDGTHCPRVTERRDWAENWIGGAEAITKFGSEAEGVKTVTLPDGSTGEKVYFKTAGWERGLTYKTETYDNTTLRKTTTTDWTQDDVNLAYQLNPRPWKTMVSEPSGKQRGSRIEYTNRTNALLPMSLPRVVYELGLNEVELRRTEIDYVEASEYQSKRILSLVKEQRLRDGAGALYSKVDYLYDQQGEQMADANQVTSHDTAGYGFSGGTNVNPQRGLVTSVRRWDVKSENDATKAVVATTGYNTAGAVVWARSPEQYGTQYKTQISYADNFSVASNNGNKFAYPTRGTDADGFYSTAEFDYHTGAVTRTRDPKNSAKPAGQGAERRIVYDANGRATRVSTFLDNVERNYVRYDYPASGQYVNTRTLVDTGSPETLAWQVFDGAGRSIAAASDHPDGVNIVAGRYTGQQTLYNVLGRVTEASNPAEMRIINGVWQAAGDDSAGWVWTNQSYDWKGRPTITTNADLTTRSVAYAGCGCAGGEVVTTTDGVGRRQRITSDALGRPIKVEDLNPNESVYRTLESIYNVRDQVVEAIERKGENGTAQSTTTEYDGHARAWKVKTPEATAQTVYEYRKDDAVTKVTDGRGAATIFAYNNRGLVTNVSYTTPDSVNIPAVHPLEFNYDARGNRLWMTDEMGRVDYSYNDLSQLEWEARQFNGISNPTASDGKYKLTYAYNLSGAVKSITDPFGSRVDYAYDAVGRTSGVIGTPFSNQTEYASEIKYRAWGETKHLKYGDGLTLDTNYNARLKASQYDFKNAAGTRVMGADYHYYRDGRLQFVDDLRDDRFDRLYKYDGFRRVTSAETGHKANGMPYASDESRTGPYNHYYGYDEFDHLTNRTGYYWYRMNANENYTASYTNNRNVMSDNQPNVWEYDADGRVTKSKSIGSTQVYEQIYKYDAAGRRADSGKLDGDGQRVKSPGNTHYYVRSSVLGGRTISEVFSENASDWSGGMYGTKASTFVYVDGEAVAEQCVRHYSFGMVTRVKWMRHDPARTSVHDRDDSVMTPSQQGGVQSALDIQGIATEAPDFAKLNQQPSYYAQHYNTGNYGSYYGAGYSSASSGGGTPGNFATFVMDGMVVPYEIAIGFIRSGAAQQCPGNNCGARRVTDGEGTRLEPLRQDRDGFYVNAFEPVDLAMVRVRIVEAGRSGGMFPTAPQAGQPAIDPAAIRADLERRLKDPKCADFIKEIIARTSREVGAKSPLVEGGDILKIFDKVMSQGGLIRAGQPGSQPGGGQAPGFIAAGNAQIQLGVWHGVYNATDVARGDGATALAEALHHAGGRRYYDYDYASAISQMPGMPRLPEGTGDPYNKDRSLYSIYFHPKVSDYCGK